MRAVPLFLALVLLLPLETAFAQDLGSPPASPSLSPAAVLDLPDPVLATAIERNRGRGALYGFAIGALAGGVGFAAMNYVFTESRPRDEYTVLSFGLGAAVGGAAGAVLGAVVGAPERQRARPQALLHLAPDLSGAGAVAVSVSVGVR